VTAWDGDDYQRRFDALAASGADVHGEADFVAALGPASVLDAGCGTGRVAIELARRGIEVVGIDADASMIDTARRLAPTITWVQGDVAGVDAGPLRGIDEPRNEALDRFKDLWDGALVDGRTV
jgi:2-polyprenyl-3-methyl-5-hydroxy-6-metoxy-1,4-benzoquinol methylase